MANLEISTACNQACPYCFAAASHHGLGGPRFLAADQLEERIGFLQRSGMDQARLIGGEPTLHPRFVAICERLRSAGLRLLVFSNGLMPAPVLDYLAGLPPAECSVLVNTNEPNVAGAARHEQRVAALCRLGERAQLGFTIHRVDFDMSFLLPVLDASGCRRTVRTGLAHPCLAGTNSHLHPKVYPVIGDRLASFARSAAGVALDFDCGFVPCMFSPTALENLKAAGAAPAWRCNPILDIGVAGRAIHCFPLADLGSLPTVAAPADPATTAAHLRAEFSRLTRPYRAAGIYPECSTCTARRGDGDDACTGGCLAAAMRRLRPAAFRLRLPQATHT
ncbi:MAG: radical SAM protein [Anaerolineae bacterium]